MEREIRAKRIQPQPPQKTIDCQKWNDPHWGFKWRAGKEGEEKAGCLRER